MREHSIPLPHRRWFLLISILLGRFLLLLLLLLRWGLRIAISIHSYSHRLLLLLLLLLHRWLLLLQRRHRRHHKMRKRTRHLLLLLLLFLCEQLHIITSFHSYRSYTLLRLQRQLQLLLELSREVLSTVLLKANIYTSSLSRTRTAYRVKLDFVGLLILVSQNAGMGKCLGTGQEHLLHQRRKDLHEERTRRLRRYSSNSLRKRKGRTGDEVRSERVTR